MAERDQIEIRLLGHLLVRRADGSVVEPAEWRTGKTLDLLRLLALEGGRPARAEGLIDKLWPDADERRGRASLRTAASQIRRTLGENCIDRSMEGLLLRNAWVDVAAFQTIAADARSAMRDSQPTRVLALAHEAESLYLGDFGAHDHGSLWAVEARQSLATIRRTLLADAAECAVELGWMHDAIDLAGRAVEVDRCNERAIRSLMRAFAGIGETEQALRAYETLRASLAEDLGGDPSALTRAVHMQVLTWHEPQTQSPEFVGVDAQVRDLRAALAGQPNPAGVVLVSGEVGSGRRTTIAHVCDKAGLPRTPLSLAGRGRLPSAHDLLAAVGAATADEYDDGARRAVVLEPIEEATGQDAKALLEVARLLAESGRVVLVAAASTDAAKVLANADGRAECLRVVHLGELDDAALTAMACAILAGPPAPELVRALGQETDRLPGSVATTLRSWLRSGSVVWTARGLNLATPSDTDSHRSAMRCAVRHTIDQLSAVQLDTLQLLAVLTRPAPTALLTALLQHAPGEGDHLTEKARRLAVERTCDALTDRGLLAAGEHGWSFRSAVVRDAVESWIRPTVRRHLHGRLARCEGLDVAEQVEHWLRGGESSRACEVALQALRAGWRRGDQEESRRLLALVRELAETLPAPDRRLLEEALAEAPREGGGGPARPDVVEHGGRAEPELAAVVPLQPPGWEVALEDAEAYDVLALDDRLTAAVQTADAHGSRADQVATRLRLGYEVALHRRELHRVQCLCDELDRLVDAPTEKAEALVLRHLSETLMGDASAVLGPLETAAQLASGTDDVGLQARIEVLRAQVAHQLGMPTLEQHLAALPSDLPLAHVDPAGLLLRLHAERGNLAEARRLAVLYPAAAASTPLHRQLRQLSNAVLLEAEGDTAGAVSMLRGAVDYAMATQCVLRLPEILARLVCLEVTSEPDAAAIHFDLFDWALGTERPTSQDICLRLLARAAIRASRHQGQRAVEAASTAAEFAEQHHAYLLAVRAHTACAEVWQEQGSPAAARMAWQAAARCYRTLGIEQAARRLAKRAMPQPVLGTTEAPSASHADVVAPRSSLQSGAPTRRPRLTSS